jgi:hypothetical protein
MGDEGDLARMIGSAKISPRIIDILWTHLLKIYHPKKSGISGNIHI